jgi:hypothetical protein
MHDRVDPAFPAANISVNYQYGFTSNVSQELHLSIITINHLPEILLVDSTN